MSGTLLAVSIFAAALACPSVLIAQDNDAPPLYVGDEVVISLPAVTDAAPELPAEVTNSATPLVAANTPASIRPATNVDHGHSRWQPRNQAAASQPIAESVGPELPAPQVASRPIVQTAPLDPLRDPFSGEKAPVSVLEQTPNDAPPQITPQPAPLVTAQPYHYSVGALQDQGQAARPAKTCEEKAADCRATWSELQDNRVVNFTKDFLDITPRFNPKHALGSADEAEEMSAVVANLEYRAWNGRGGNSIAQGRLANYRWGKVVIESLEGGRQHIPVSQLSDVDLCYLNSHWGKGIGLPDECRLGEVGSPLRNYTMITYTWKASALCHKPLYFEEVQLERYGHSAGPCLQPVLSGAHFFANIAILPYKMGIHPPCECIYALGYYRPGNCAPYMVPAVPISVRGGLMQAGAVVGAAAIIP